jgi:hypothetical protein
MGKIRTTLKSPSILLPATIVLIVLLLLSWLVPWLLTPADPHGRRWSSFAPVEPSAEFGKLLKNGPVGTESVGGSASTDWHLPHVDVYTFATTKVPPVVPTLKDLAAVGQAHAIDFLASSLPADHHTWAQLREALVDAGTEAAADKDPFRFDRVLVATVTRGADWHPGDRMVWTRVFVQPINFSFAGYTVAATENDTLKVTSVEATHTQKFSADLGLTIPGVDGPKATISPSNEKTVKSSSDVTEQYEKLGVDIKSDFLRIVRESEAGGDVLGNALISLSVVTDPATIRKRLPAETIKTETSNKVVLQVTATHLQEEEAGGPEAADPITYSPQPWLPHCPLLARVWMVYEERQIRGDDWKYYDEGQQNVSLLREADSPKDVEILSADDVSPAVWHVKIIPVKAGSAAADKPSAEPGEHDQLLQATSPGGDPRDLVFTSYSQASALAHWLRTKNPIQKGEPIKIKELTLNYNGGLGLVPFKETHDQCRPGEAGKSATNYTPVQASP